MNLGIDDKPERKRRISWWKQRTTTQRTIFVFIGIAIAVTVFFVLALIVAKTYNGNTSSLCLTRGCIRAAEEILKYIDPSADPCEDFHQFACGQFLKNAIIPEDRTSINSYTSINELLDEKLKIMLVEPLKDTAEKPFALLNKLYNLCLNTTAIELLGLKNINAIIQDLGGWPILNQDSWDANKFDWMETLHKYRERGVPVSNFIGLQIGPHPRNSTKRIIIIDEAALSISRENLLNGLEDKIVKAYYNLLLEFATLFGASRNEIGKEVNDVIKFQIELAKISTSPEQKRNISAMMNFLSVSEVQQRFPSIPWLSFINKILGNATKPIESGDIILIPTPKYIGGLEGLLQTSSKRVQANYVIFRTITAVAPFLTEAFRKHLKDFVKITFGTDQNVPRPKECVTITSTLLEIAAASMYVRKYFKEESKRDVKEIVSNIQTEFKKILEKADWMDTVTKQKAREKAEAMVVHIGYPDELLDRKALENHYLELNPADDYFNFVLNILKFQMDKAVKKLPEPYNQTEWIRRTMPITLNAGYRPSENSIEFPAAILQGIFFQHDRPQYLNYGGIGYVIGHEITHGFDDRGKQFDKNGNVLEWWAENTDQAYKLKAQCIIEQYGNYTIPEISKKVNGLNTQGENIADNGGIKEAYLAYNEWVKHNYEERLLPGVNYTTRQMFWISSAILWCSKERSESLEQFLNVDSHPPARFRTQGPLSNSIEFAKDFKCRAGAKMNPEKKCSVW